MRFVTSQYDPGCRIVSAVCGSVLGSAEREEPQATFRLLLTCRCAQFHRTSNLTVQCCNSFRLCSEWSARQCRDGAAARREPGCGIRRAIARSRLQKIRCTVCRQRTGRREPCLAEKDSATRAASANRGAGRSDALHLGQWLGTASTGATENYYFGL